MAEAVSDLAWLRALLETEATLAAAEAGLGLIPEGAAQAILAACDAGGFDLEELGRQAVASASPVVPLVAALRARLPADAADHVHWGATSQDLLDTAMMLVARQALNLVLADLEGLAEACAELAARHRETLIAGRTLLQQALPTTFGLKAAGWLMAVIEARQLLSEWRERRLAVQLGGAAGTLAAFGDRGLEVMAALGRELELPEPVLPWHTSRARVAELGAGLAVAAGCAGKIGLDVALLMQTEVGEASEPAPGGSSALPYKRNPVSSVEINACVRGVNAQVSLLLGCLPQEHERAAGAWQAEWPALSEAFRLTAGAVARARAVVAGLEVDVKRMRANLELSQGLLFSESVLVALAARIGRRRAQELVAAAASRSAASGTSFEAELMAEPEIAAELGAEGVVRALEPASYLGSAALLIDRALAAHRETGRSRR